jgi:DNA-binding transcriptional LysR family regulator
MEINKLKYFKVIYESRSIRKAAELLKMSPGSLSKSIKSLEVELNIQLFKADGRNIVPTEVGIETYKKAIKLLDSYDEFSKDVEEKVNSTKVLKIATWEVFSTYLIASICKNEQHIKDFNILALERVPSSLEKAIISGQADIGITYEPIPHTDLEFIKIKSFKFNVYCAKHVEDDCLKLPFAVPITAITDSIFNTKSLDSWPKNISRNIKYQFEMLETALETTRSGLSLIHCPDFVALLQNKYLKSHFTLIPISYNSKMKTVSKDIYLVTRRNYPESTLAKKVAKAVRMNC